MDELDRKTVFGIPAAVAAIVRLEAPREVVGDASVEGGVFASDEVDVPGHGFSEGGFSLRSELKFCLRQNLV